MKLKETVQKLLGLPSDEKRAKEEAQQAISQDRYDEAYDEIKALPFDVARRRAEHLLADPEKFECGVSPVPSVETLAIFAPGLRALFSRYESIAVIGDEASLSRSEIQLFDYDGNGLSWGLSLWLIGAAHRHSATFAKPHDEAIYNEIDGELSEPLPSIYHWLLWVSARASNLGL